MIFLATDNKRQVPSNPDRQTDKQTKEFERLIDHLLICDTDKNL